MQYDDDVCLNELERDAYQRGDTQTAELLGMVLDQTATHAEELASTEEDKAEAERLQEKAEGELADLKAALQDRIQVLDDAIEGAKRIGNREAIEAAVTALWGLAS